MVLPALEVIPQQEVEHLRRLFPDAAEDSLLKTIVDFRAV